MIKIYGSGIVILAIFLLKNDSIFVSYNPKFLYIIGHSTFQLATAVVPENTILAPLWC